MQDRAVWKVNLLEGLVHDLPIGAKALHVDYQHNAICVWLLVKVDAPKIKQGFIVAGTGWTLPELLKPEMHAGTVQRDGLIWHVFHLGPLENLKPYDRRSIEMTNEEAQRMMPDDAEG